jgi:hypothetical protein
MLPIKTNLYYRIIFFIDFGNLLMIDKYKKQP